MLKEAKALLLLTLELQINRTQMLKKMFAISPNSIKSLSSLVVIHEMHCNTRYNICTIHLAKDICMHAWSYNGLTPSLQGGH